VRELFVAAARGRIPAAEVLVALQDRSAAAATRTLPRDVSSFTGRDRELARLDGGLAAIHVIDGMAGIGKTNPGANTSNRYQSMA
jgi:hypothetical protein